MLRDRSFLAVFWLASACLVVVGCANRPPPSSSSSSPAKSKKKARKVISQAAFVQVTSTDVSQFYYLSEAIFRDLSPNAETAATMVRASAAYGPYALSSASYPIRVRVGRSYLILPVCDDKIDVSRLQQIKVVGGIPPGQVKLTCKT